MSASVAVTAAAVGLRGAGMRYAPAPEVPGHQLSRRARSIAIETPEQAWAEYRAQADSGSYAGDAAWSKGSLWACLLCGAEFVSSSGARKHMRTQDHPVIRWLDRYEEELMTCGARSW